MASVSLNQRFAVVGDSGYTPASASVPADEPGSPPALPIPLNWTPDPTLLLDRGSNELRLTFTEPAAWSRGAWHLPASASGFYVPAVLYPSNRAWIGEGPRSWGVSVDGVFYDANLSTGGPGARTTLSFLPSALASSSGQPLDWTQPHTFRLHLLYQDVPEYQWWGYDGSFGLAPKGTDVQHYYFFPQDRFRALNFYDGYPDGEPVQPVLPPGLTALDYGGLGPIQVPGEHLLPGGRFASQLAFTNHREPGVWLEVVSDPYTLSLPATPLPIVTAAGFTSVRIDGTPVVGSTLTAVLS